MTQFVESFTDSDVVALDVSNAIECADGEDHRVELLVIPELREVKANGRGLRPVAGFHAGEEPFGAVLERGLYLREITNQRAGIQQACQRIDCECRLFD